VCTAGKGPLGMTRVTSVVRQHYPFDQLEDDRLDVLRSIFDCGNDCDCLATVCVYLSGGQKMAIFAKVQVAAGALQWPYASVVNPCNLLRGGTGVLSQARYVRKVLAVADSKMTLIRAAEAVPNDESRLRATSSVVLPVLGVRCQVQLRLQPVAAVAAGPPYSA